MGRKNTEAGFWATARRGEPDTCWLWSKALSLPHGNVQGGYGRAHFGGKQNYAHRVAWRLAKGPIPEGMMVCHACDSRYAPGDPTYRACCNPAHLFLATNDENMADMVTKGRVATGDRHNARLYPERRPRGDAHWTRRNPEKVPRGARNGAYTHPESRPRGDRSGPHLHPERMTRGEAHHEAKLSADQVRAIRERYAAGGISQTALGEQYGVGQSIVSAIVRRTSWAHLP